MWREFQRFCARPLPACSHLPAPFSDLKPPLFSGGNEAFRGFGEGKILRGLPDWKRECPQKPHAKAGQIRRTELCKVTGLHSKHTCVQNTRAHTHTHTHLQFWVGLRLWTCKVSPSSLPGGHSGCCLQLACSNIFELR